MINVFEKEHSLDDWVHVINKSYSEVPFQKRANEIIKILSVDSNKEIKKINKASLIVFGETLGVTSFSDACKKLGISTKLPIISDLGEDQIKKFIAEYKLTIIIRALNEGWYPNWKDTNEIKYCPYFYYNKCGFSYNYTVESNTGTIVPSALFLKSRELAEYCGKMFIDLYKIYYK